jgi:hypothetical protein
MSIAVNAAQISISQRLPKSHPPGEEPVGSDSLQTTGCPTIMTPSMRSIEEQVVKQCFTTNLDLSALDSGS